MLDRHFVGKHLYFNISLQVVMTISLPFIFIQVREENILGYSLGQAGHCLVVLGYNLKYIIVLDYEIYTMNWPPFSINPVKQPIVLIMLNVN